MIKQFFISLLIFILISSCSKEVDLSAVDNLNNGKIFIVGHGGTGFETLKNPLPPDSWSSIQKTVDVYNADGVDVDIRISKDSVLFLCHNGLLESITDCSGCIYEKTFNELQNCAYKQDYDLNLFAKEKLITLDFLFENFSNRINHPLVILDIKTDYLCGQLLIPSYDTYVNQIFSVIKKFNADSWVNIISSDIIFLNKLKIKLPDVPLYIDGEFNSSVQAATTYGYQGISVNNDHIDKDQVKTAHDNGIKVLLFGIKLKSSTKDAIKKNPDILDTDNISVTQEVLLNN